jgi:hypothetical protein
MPPWMLLPIFCALVFETDHSRLSGRMSPPRGKIARFRMKVRRLFFMDLFFTANLDIDSLRNVSKMKIFVSKVSANQQIWAYLLLSPVIMDTKKSVLETPL